MKVPQSELRAVDRTYRLKKGLETGIYKDEFGVRIHIGGYICAHGQSVFGCEKCKEKTKK